MEKETAPKKSQTAAKAKTKSPRVKASEDSVHFAYFLRLVNGARGDEIEMKIGASNNVAQYRKDLAANFMYDIKPEEIIYCVKGDAEKVVSDFVSKHKPKAMQNGWYKASKTALSQFTEELVKSPDYDKSNLTRARVK